MERDITPLAAAKLEFSDGATSIAVARQCASRFLKFRAAVVARRTRSGQQHSGPRASAECLSRDSRRNRILARHHPAVNDREGRPVGCFLVESSDSLQLVFDEEGHDTGQTCVGFCSRADSAGRRNPIFNSLLYAEGVEFDLPLN